MLRTHVNNDIYNIYCLIHNNENFHFYCICLEIPVSKLCRPLQTLDLAASDLSLQCLHITQKLVSDLKRVNFDMHILDERS